MPQKDPVARKQYFRTWHARNREKVRQYKKEWRAGNRERIQAAYHRYRLKGRDRLLVLARAKREQNRDTLREYQRNYQEQNKERLRAYARRYYLMNADKIKAYHTRTREHIREMQRARVQKHIERVRAYRRAYNARAYELFKGNMQKQLAHGIRKRFRVALANPQKSGLARIRKVGSAVKLLGCTVAQAIQHVESQFKPGMSWDNWSLHGWHIDHILPLSSFDLTDPDQLATACHYTNLQPLWAVDNIRKGGAACKRDSQG